MAAMQADGVNTRYLPGARFPDGLVAEPSLEHALAGELSQVRPGLLRHVGGVDPLLLSGLALSGANGRTAIPCNLSNSRMRLNALPVTQPRASNCAR